MVANFTPNKKRPPNENELAFIQLARKVRARKIHSREEIDAANINGRLRDAAYQLLNAAQQDGSEGFTTLWDTFVRTSKIRSDLAPLIDTPAPPEENTTSLEDEHFVTTKDGKRLLKLYSIEDIYAAPDPNHLIEGIFDQCGLSMLYGTSGTGKTFTTLHMALTVAHGLAWHGRDVEAGPVWYINTEGKASFKKRLRAWYIEHTDLTPTPAFKIIPWSLQIKEHYQELVDTIKAADSKPVLLVIDNFSMTTTVNQNHQEEVAPVLGLLNDLAQSENFHILLIHHTNKEGDVNGTMAFRNHVDVMVELKKEDRSNPHSPIVFHYIKSRDLEPFEDIRTELKSIEVYVHEKTLKPITSCVVVDSETPAPQEETPQNVLQMLEILQAHGKLTCSQWLKQCREVHQISEPTFYRLKRSLEKDALITAATGRGAHITLTEKGSELIG